MPFTCLSKRPSFPVLLSVCAVAMVVAPAVAQASPDVQQSEELLGSRWSFSWGWNRAQYTSSDIHLKGRDHDFVLQDVHAEDRQNTLTWGAVFNTFLNPGRLTIPQTNARIAYQLSADMALALNFDHMKYVVSDGQYVAVSGQINGEEQTGQQLLDPDFFHYEHTDGLNVISLEVETQKPVLFDSGLSARLFGLAGVGAVVPRSNITLTFAGQEPNDEFHLAGYALSLGGGFEMDFLKYFFVRTTGKVGYVDLPDVKTSSRGGDKASQHFTYNEVVLAFGGRF